MITLSKWFPFVHPTPYDVKTIAFEKRIERLDNEYRLAVKAQKVRDAVEVYDLELYNKRARQNTVELEVFRDTKRFQVLV